MAEAKATYIITQKAEHMETFEAVVAAVGAYQEELPDTAVHEAFLSEDEASDTATVSLVRTASDTAHYGRVQEMAEQMRRGIERHLPEDRREEVSRYFAGIAVHGDLLHRE